AGMAAAAAAAALAGEPDALPVGHAGRHPHVEGPLPVRALQGDRPLRAVVRLLDGHLQLGLLVGTGNRAPAAPGPAAAQPAQQVLEIDAPDAPADRPARAERAARAAWAVPARTRPARACPSPGPAPRLRVHVLGHLAEIGAERVVATAGLRVRQHRVGLGDVLEPVLSPRILVDVGMGGAGELPVGLLALILARAPRLPP